MRKKFVYSLLTILAITGCQTKELETPENNEEPEVIQDSKVFTAIIDENTSGDTKTSLDEEGNVLWKKGDQVSIFAGSTVNEHYQVTDASDGKTAASLNKVGDGGFVAGTEIDNNVAFYPYASTAEIAKSGSNYVISEIELPATQNYAAGSFGNGAFPMAAVTSSKEDMNLKFKNILGGLKLQLKGAATIRSITVSGNNNELLYGSAEVTVTAGKVPSLSLTDASAKSVTLDCGTGVALSTETATPFVIALPPITMTGGFTVLVTDTEGEQMEISTSRSQTITRSSLLKMPEVDYVVTSKYSSEPFTITSRGSTSVSMNKYGAPADIALEYRKGLDSWAAYTIGTVVDLSDGETLQFRSDEDGNDTISQGYNNNYYYINAAGTGTIIASGNIMSLLDRGLRRESLSDYCFANLFTGCNKLVDAANLKLPATTLAMDCYYRMFQKCTGLTSAPVLPATTLASYCYSYMFSGCTGLTTAPELPATTLAKRCYYGMFYGCTGLTSAPVLPATTLANICYGSMFYGCTGLTTAPELPATTLADNCYASMFRECTGLTTAPALPATTLASGCYQLMFRDCTGLTTAPELPATTLADYCYDSMFSHCADLTTAPELPATTLAERCYYGMFLGCPGLTTAPELPATTLAKRCYYGMFFGCTGLTSAPVLPATTLAEGCYGDMFAGCAKLNYIKALFTTTPSNSYTENWVSGVASTGTFIKSSAATWSEFGDNGIPSGWTVDYVGSVTEYEYTISTSAGGTKASWSGTDMVWSTGDKVLLTDGTNSALCTIPSTYDGLTTATVKTTQVLTGTITCIYPGDAVTLDGSTIYVDVPEDQGTNGSNYEVYSGSSASSTIALSPATALFKVRLSSSVADLDYIKITFEGAPVVGRLQISELGNTVISGTQSVQVSENGGDEYLFSVLPGTITSMNVDIVKTDGTIGRKTASSSRTISAGTITSLPINPATFSFEDPLDYFTITSTGSTSVVLNKVGSPADVALEYRKNGGDWTSYTIGSSVSLSDGETLQFRSDEDGNDTFSQDCWDNYYSFDVTGTGTIIASGNIMSLLDRSLEITSVPQSAFSILFRNCTKLVGASELKLPATTLANRCYQGMFNGCTGLTSAPELPATTLTYACYSEMFRGCTGLTSAPELPATTLANWCYSYMFYDCTGLTSAPELPATTLANHCYQVMFNGCTGLTSAPELPATTLVDYCYDSMFNGCTGLTSAPELPATTLTYACYADMFKGCSKLNYIKMLATDISARSCLSDWVNGVSATGTFVKSSSATWDETGSSGVPSGWTVETE